MEKFVIKGPSKLKGTVTVSGAKNAALPILSATLLTDDSCIIKNIPSLVDIKTMTNILVELGMSVTFKDKNTIITKPINSQKYIAPYDWVNKMRASVCVLGPLLAKRKKAKVSLPGGCVIGVRPIDLHIKGLRKVGAKVSIQHGYINAKARKLKGTEIYLGGPFGPTVTGTANLIMAASLAEGITIIENAACEPEIQDLCRFLIKMGAKIENIGTPRLKIKGVNKLHGASHSIIPDRIEAGTLILAAAVTKSPITIKNCPNEFLSSLIDKLNTVGVQIIKSGRMTSKIIPDPPYAPTHITTLPYPGFPTDLQAQFTVLLTTTNGISVVTEKIYPDRFMHIAELNRMGADIRKEGPNAIIQGVKHLYGAQVMASDLRASAALVLAGISAYGTTEINRIYHIDRGYENIEKKLNKLGASIERVKE